MATVYKSKIDTWLLFVLAAAMIVALFATFVVISTGTSGAWWMAAFTITIGIGLPLWLILSTRYTLESHQLVVKSGPFKWRINLADIISITPTSNPLSSPALSLDRLRIDYGDNRSLMVSPRDQEKFVLAVEVARRAAA